MAVLTTSGRTDVADALRPVIEQLLGPQPPVVVRCWDGSVIGPPDAPATLVVHTPRALRRLLYAPNELGLSRAYVAGELEVVGDIYALLAVRDRLAERDPAASLHLGLVAVLRAARRVGALGPPLAPPPEEARLAGRRHSQRRDARAVSHHYDVGNDFYRLLLGPTLTYSCAYWRNADGDLDTAQRAKYELVCSKLGLRPGMRLLDVGCGWGGMVLHAAEHHGVEAVGVTLSAEQEELARSRVIDAGLAGQVEIRRCDYREIDDGPYDAVSSIGMFEHVGLAKLQEYFGRLAGLLHPEGRLLNHAISRPSGSAAAIDEDSFLGRFVFPDGELHEVGTVVSAMQEHRFEVRDVESLREHYALTLRRWVANLEEGWAEAVRLVGPARARIWRLYLAGSAVNFEAGRTSVHQVLGVRPAPRGRSGMPLTRADLAI